jgi:TDG/mug DNA glycosylase family protein
MGKRTIPPAQELAEARAKTLTDVLRPQLWVLFCGINPGLYSALTGHHFARPGNRFWPTLYRSGFTDRLLAPSEEQELLTYGIGLTNLVSRATTSAAELNNTELLDGGRALRATAQQYQPQVVAILGVSAYRIAFQQPKAQVGRQPQSLEGAQLWALPSPSGLNAHFTPNALAALFQEFRQTIINDIGPYTPTQQ